MEKPHIRNLVCNKEVIIYDGEHVWSDLLVDKKKLVHPAFQGQYGAPGIRGGPGDKGKPVSL